MPANTLLPEFKIEAYDFDLPKEQIAQEPTACREKSRLMVMDTRQPLGRELSHHRFSYIRRLLHKGDLLVLNDTRVLSRPPHWPQKDEPAVLLKSWILGVSPDN